MKRPRKVLPLPAKDFRIESKPNFITSKGFKTNVINPDKKAILLKRQKHPTDGQSPHNNASTHW